MIETIHLEICLFLAHFMTNFFQANALKVRGEAVDRFALSLRCCYLEFEKKAISIAKIYGNDVRF